MTNQDFDAFGFLEGLTFPTEEVTLYVDESAAYAASKLLDEKAELETAGKGAKRIAAIDKELKALADSLTESAIVVTLRGTHSGKIEEILGRDDSDDDSTNQNLIAAFMVSISAQGKTDEREFTGADVARFKGLIPSRSWQELNQAVHRIIVASLAFDRMGDAGFFPKS